MVSTAVEKSTANFAVRDPVYVAVCHFASKIMPQTQPIPFSR